MINIDSVGREHLLPVKSVSEYKNISTYHVHHYMPYVDLGMM